MARQASKRRRKRNPRATSEAQVRREAATALVQRQRRQEAAGVDWPNISREVSIFTGGPDDEIRILFHCDGESPVVYTVDRAINMSFSTRIYVSNLVASILMLGNNLSGRYNHPPLERVKRAVRFQIDTINYLDLHQILGSIEPRDHYVGDVTGSIELNGWDLDPDWLTQD